MKIAELILKYIEVLIWPGITTFIIFKFRKEITKLFERAKKVELPGGISIEAFENKLEEAKKLEKEIKAERKPEIANIISKKPQHESEVNQRMIDLELTPSPSGLDINYYNELAIEDLQLAMAGLRMDLEIMLRNLAKGFKIESTKNESLPILIRLLLNKDAITQTQAEFLKIIFQLTNYAAHGGEVSIHQLNDVLNLSKTLIDDYIAWLDWGFE